MEILVLGTGCPKCKALEKTTIEAVASSGIEATVRKEENIMEIMKYTMSTPALVVDGKVVLKGRIPSPAELVQTLINLQI